MKEMSSRDDSISHVNVPRDRDWDLSHKLFSMMEASIYLCIASLTIVEVFKASSSSCSISSAGDTGEGLDKANVQSSNSNQSDDVMKLIWYCAILQFASALLAFIVTLLYECSCTKQNAATITRTSSSTKRGQSHIAQRVMITDRKYDDIGDADEDAKGTGTSTTTTSVGKYNSTIWLKTDIHSMGVSFGSTVPALIMLIPEIQSRIGSDGIFSNQGEDTNIHLSTGRGIGIVYAMLLALVGFSFALSTLILSLQYDRRENDIRCIYTTAKNPSKAMTTTFEEEKGNVIHTMLSIFVLLIAFIVHMMRGRGTMKHVILFAMMESLLLLLYNHWVPTASSFDSNSRKGSKRELSSSAKKFSPFQLAFTLGEWIIVSSYISLLASDYILRYKVVDGIFWTGTHTTLDGSGSGSGSGSETEHASENYVFNYYEEGIIAIPSDHLVMHAGIVGCLAGVFISSTILPIVMGFITNCSNVFFRFHHLGLILHCAAHIIVVVMTTIMALNFALGGYCIDDSAEEGNAWCENDQYLSGGSETGYSIISVILSHSPICIRWLIYFLQETEHVNLLNGSGGIGIPIPRYIWLLYWCAVLTVLGPIAVLIANVLKKCETGKKKKLTVVARKYFHLVAVVLFFTPTLFAPKMMGVSYAIATALFILLERVRMTTVAYSKDVKTNDKLVKDEADDGTIDFNNFFEMFFDEKDKGAATEEGFVVTHAALLMGCGIPLWYHNIYHSENTGTGSIVPFIGILSLGIGDSAGAIVGSLFGRKRWPGSRRSIEGSLAVLISMSICSFVTQYGFADSQHLPISVMDQSIVLFLLTALEAVTVQIDNLCLPFLGIIAFEILRWKSS